ncbi:MAG TPA: hypothetical protein VKU40_19790 [Thermoanaerobaculia bacterium]|nr:hypothetical protein [Thermoanaerobaculia bacterium]
MNDSALRPRLTPGSWFGLAAGVGASLLLAVPGLLLPLPPDDPFAGTLAVLPAIVAALLVLDREVRRRGARAANHRAAAWWPAAEGAALVALAGFTLGRGALALDTADAALAAGWLLLLAQRVWRQVVALRPLLGRRLPERPSLVFFFLPLVVYLALVPWSTFQRPPDGDEPFYLLITHSLAYDLDADLTDNYAEGDWRDWLDRPLEPQPGDPVGPRGELYSRHNEALPIVLAPAYRVAGKFGALATMAALTALLAWMVLRLAYRYFPDRPGESLLAWAVFSFSPPLILYSGQVWVEVPAALLSMIALDRIRGFRGRPQWGLKPWLTVGLPVVLLPLLKIRFMLLAVPLVGLAWWHAGRPRKPLILLTLALVLVGGGILVHNQLLYDNPLKIHDVEELELTDYPWTAYVYGTLGLFWDSAFGLFACAPLWLLLLPAAIRLFERSAGPARRLAFDLAVYATPYLLIVVPRSEWYGGWSPPFRYALVALPLLALLLVPLLAGRRRAGARALVAALLVATAAFALLWLVVPGWTYNFADGRTYLLDHLSARAGSDVARLFPSSVRPRLATWLWPPLTLLVACGLWWWPRKRPASVRRAALWGTAALLAVAALVPAVAARLPTRVVEFEDAWVDHPAGGPFPQRWVIERTRYRGGWVLREGTSLAAPVEPGGDEVTIRLAARFIPNVPGRPIELVVRAGDEPLATWQVPLGREWGEVELGPFAWPAGEPLVVVAGQPRREFNGVILDRAVLEWK